jgi:hypothetical protein
MRWFHYIWAFPGTFLGLALLPLAYCSGGRCRIVRGCVEIHGGIVTRLLQRGLPFAGSAAAMTLGHVILGCDATCLEISRDHEHVHVRQYERWGPLFIPAYFAASLYIYLRGGDAYLDNPFEREAFGRTDECRDRTFP